MKLIGIALLLLGLQQTLRVDVSVVTVGVRVTDSRGRDVRDLKAEDFRVFDDGAAQKIAFFSNETQPVTLGILLDHSSSMDSNDKIDRAKDAARALVGGAREGSEFFYIEFDDEVKLAADLTTDRQKVVAAIQQTVPDGGTSLYDATLAGIGQAGRAKLARQVLVIISDGVDQHSTHNLRQLINIVRDSKIQIFTIGYFSKEDERIYRSSGTTMTLIDGVEVDNPRLVLEKIADESGAKSFFPRSDVELAQAVAEINKDLATQYTVSFYKPPDRGNEYHQLRVEVPAGRYNVRARPGYGTREFAPGNGLVP